MQVIGQKGTPRWPFSVPKIFVCGKNIATFTLYLSSTQRRLILTESRQDLDVHTTVLCNLRVDLLKCYKILHYFVDISLDEFFTDSHDKITRSNSFKLIVPNSRVDAGTDFFSIRFIYVWKRISDEIVNTSSISTFYIRLLKTDFIISILTA